jgi:hypothetical protein
METSVRPYYVLNAVHVLTDVRMQTVSAWNVITLLMQDLFGYKVTQSWAEWQD